MSSLDFTYFSKAEKREDGSYFVIFDDIQVGLMQIRGQWKIRVLPNYGDLHMEMHASSAEKMAHAILTLMHAKQENEEKRDTTASGDDVDKALTQAQQDWRETLDILADKDHK